MLASLGENFNLSTGENSIICGSDSCEKKNNIVIPILGSVGGLFILSLTVAAILWGHRKRKQQDKTTGENFKYKKCIHLSNTKLSCSCCLSSWNSNF